MHKAALFLLIASSGIVAACADTMGSSDRVRIGHWGSDQADASVTDTGVTLRILASGSCYGSYAAITQSIPTGSFAVAGTYTQLIGAYPGKVDYPAQYTGTATSGRLSITIIVNALQQTFGPFTLTYGDAHTWPACMYP